MENLRKPSLCDVMVCRDAPQGQGLGEEKYATGRGCTEEMHSQTLREVTQSGREGARSRNMFERETPRHSNFPIQRQRRNGD
eukprot:1379056-Amorphochlora_amoeboformis.AAC.1